MFLRDPTTGGGGRDKEGAYMYVYDSCIASCLIFFQGTLLCCNLGTPHSEKKSYIQASDPSNNWSARVLVGFTIDECFFSSREVTISHSKQCREEKALNCLGLEYSSSNLYIYIYTLHYFIFYIFLDHRDESGCLIKCNPYQTSP